MTQGSRPRAGRTIIWELARASAGDHDRCYVLHGPRGYGWSAEDLEAWGAMEALQRAGKTRLIGVSNVSLEQLQSLCEHAAVKPALLQNAASRATDGTRRARVLPRARLVYEGFSSSPPTAASSCIPRRRSRGRSVGRARRSRSASRCSGHGPLTGDLERDICARTWPSSISSWPRGRAGLERIALDRRARSKQKGRHAAPFSSAASSHSMSADRNGGRPNRRGDCGAGQRTRLLVPLRQREDVDFVRLFQRLSVLPCP